MNTNTHNGFSLVEVLIVLVSLGVIAGISFLYLTKIPSINNIPPTPSPENQIFPTLTPASDPTADWKTYTNDKLYFSLKYPDTFTLLSETNSYYGASLSLEAEGVLAIHVSAESVVSDGMIKQNSQEESYTIMDKSYTTETWGFFEGHPNTDDGTFSSFSLSNQQIKLDNGYYLTISTTVERTEVDGEVISSRKPSPLIVEQIRPIVESFSMEVFVISPSMYAAVSPPFTISGLIDTSWVFEASFPVTILDEVNNVILSTYGTTKDWTHAGWTEFTIEIDPDTQELQELFSETTEYPNAQLIIRNANPSGLEEYSKSYTHTYKIIAK